MSAHDFSRAQLCHVSALAGSSQLTAFTTAMRIDTEETRWLERAAAYVAANRPAWDRIDALHAKCDARTITAAEAIELLKLERESA